MCLGCLELGHQIKDCRYRRDCKVDGCTKNHHPSIHVNKSVESGGEEAAVTSANVSTSTGPCIQPNIALGVIQVSLIGVDGELVKANALIDEGSDSSLATKALVRKLGLCGAKGPLHVSGVVGRQQQQNSEFVRLRVASPDSKLYDVNV